MTTPNRIYNQYYNKPKARKWYDIVPTIAAEVEAAALRVSSSWDIDTATGALLDALEALVVVPKNENASTIPSNLDADEVRRLIIKATIAKNTNDASYDGLVTALVFITGNSKLTIIDNEDMSLSVIFGFQLTDEQRYIFTNYDVLPRINGVLFRGFADAIPASQFGDEADQFGGDTQFGYLFGG